MGVSEGDGEGVGVSEGDGEGVEVGAGVGVGKLITVTTIVSLRVSAPSLAASSIVYVPSAEKKGSSARSSCIYERDQARAADFAPGVGERSRWGRKSVIRG